MAGIFRDGFDSYNGNGATVGLLAKYLVQGGVSLRQGRFGGQSVYLGDGNGITGIFDKATPVFSASMGIRVDNQSSNGNRPQIYFNSGGTYTLGLQFYTGSTIVVYRTTGRESGQELGRTSPLALRPDIWYTLEMEVEIHATAGRVTIWVDGDRVLNLVNVNTSNGVSGVDSIILGGIGGAASGITVDDLYITDSATKLEKAVRIVTLPVNADGSTLEFTPSSGSSHSAVVGEIPASAANYLSATNVGQRDVLGLTDLATTPVAIEEVAVVAYMNKTDAPARSMFLGVISGATTSDGAAQNLNASGFRHERSLPVDPNTGAAWTPGGVNALQLQPKVAT